MFRKVTLAIAAIATIGAAALAPTAASAHWKGKGWGWGYGYGYGAYIAAPVATYVAVDYSCWRKYWVDTPLGPVLKKVYVCNYTY